MAARFVADAVLEVRLAFAEAAGGPRGGDASAAYCDWARLRAAAGGGAAGESVAGTGGRPHADRVELGALGDALAFAGALDDAKLIEEARALRRVAGAVAAARAALKGAPSAGGGAPDFAAVRAAVSRPRSPSSRRPRPSFATSTPPRRRPTKRTPRERPRIQLWCSLGRRRRLHWPRRSRPKRNTRRPARRRRRRRRWYAEVNMYAAHKLVAAEDAVEAEAVAAASWPRDTRHPIDACEANLAAAPAAPPRDFLQTLLMHNIHEKMT